MQHHQPEPPPQLSQANADVERRTWLQQQLGTWPPPSGSTALTSFVLSPSNLPKLASFPKSQKCCCFCHWKIIGLMRYIYIYKLCWIKYNILKTNSMVYWETYYTKLFVRISYIIKLGKVRYFYEKLGVIRFSKKHTVCFYYIDFQLFQIKI